MTKDPTKARAYRSVRGFFYAWQKQDWDGMLATIQTTWRAGPFDKARIPWWNIVARARRKQKWDPSRALEANLGHVDVRSMRIEGARRISPCIWDVSCRVKLSVGPEPSFRRMICRVIGEVGVREPDPLGRFGVNPISVWRKSFGKGVVQLPDTHQSASDH